MVIAEQEIGSKKIVFSKKQRIQCVCSFLSFKFFKLGSISQSYVVDIKHFLVLCFFSKDDTDEDLAVGCLRLQNFEASETFRKTDLELFTSSGVFAKAIVSVWP